MMRWVARLVLCAVLLSFVAAVLLMLMPVFGFFVLLF